MQKIMEIYNILEGYDYKDVAKALFMREAETDLSDEELEVIYDYYENTDGLTLISRGIIDKIADIEDEKEVI